MDEFLLIASQQYEKSTSVQKTAEIQQTPSANGVTEIVDVQKKLLTMAVGVIYKPVTI